MTNKMLAPLTNKWQFTFEFSKDYRSLDRGWKYVEIGLVNIIKMPPPGEIIRKSQYKGFLIQFLVWLPFDKA